MLIASSINALQQEVARLQSELKSSNERLESEMKASSDLRKEMKGVLSYICQNVLGNHVPSEFAHLVNPQVD